MPVIAIERVPVRQFGLGILGFDHLQLVYRQDEISAVQDGWFVIEGQRETVGGEVVLAVVGADATTTLSEANGDRTGQDLIDRIGTAASRGSRDIATFDATLLWAQMATFAGDIDGQSYDYLAFAPTSSPYPTVNSSSLIASLLYYVGVDITSVMPFSLRFSPGTTTLLGSSSTDTLSISMGFTTILGGEGNDVLGGSDDPSRIDKLYGGRDNDRLTWSSGFNILHGGQPGIDYAADGIDVVDYAGAGLVRIDVNPHAVPHLSPDFIATRTNGTDHLYSIERVAWDQASDLIVLGPGVELLDERATLDLGSEQSGGRGDQLDLSAATEPLLVNAGADDLIFVQGASRGETNAGLWAKGAEWIVGSSGADRIFSGLEVRGIEGGAGADLIDARLAEAFAGLSPEGYDVEIAGGAGDDTIVSGRGRTLASGGEGADRFVLSQMTLGTPTVELVIADAESADRLFVPYTFFDGSFGTNPASELLPLLGAMAQLAGQSSFDDLPENLGPWTTGPASREDFFRFEWQLEADRFYGSDESDGLITFSGAILYNRDGADLLIHLFLGAPFEVTEEGSNGQPWTHQVNFFFSQTETIIRVQNFDEGDLGIVFHDPGEPTAIDIETDHGSYSVFTYPNWDAAVTAMAGGGVFAPALDAKPATPEYDPEDTGPGDDENVVAGTDDPDVITLATATVDATVRAGDGADSITTGSGDDLIDGGAGDDSMAGGAGDDLYLVNSPGDTVVELASGGIDRVISGVSFVLPDFVEHLTLIEPAASVGTLSATALDGTGNAAANKLLGSTGSNTLSGLGGSDTLYGGGGDDVLAGGTGSDGYVYVTNDGRDRIVDLGEPGDRDLLILGGIDPDDVFFHRLVGSPSDLVLTFRPGGRIAVESFGAAAGNGIEAVSFDDGTLWDRAALDARWAAAPIVASDAPQAIDDLEYVLEGNDILVPAEALLANDTDYDGDPLTIVAVSDISPGATVTLEAGGIRIVTAPGSTVSVGFTYTVSDGAGGTATARAEFEVVPADETPNAAPSPANDAGFNTRLGTPLEIAADELLANDFDPDGEALEVVAVSDAEHGTVALEAGGIVRFTPVAGYAGPAAFTYTVADERGATASARVTLTVVVAGAVITGTSGADILRGTPDADLIDGLEGDDVLIGRAGDDVFRIIGTNNGFDAFKGGAGFDTVLGSAGDDIIGVANVTGHLAGIEAIDGGAGYDIIRLTAGDDTLNLAGIAITGIELIEGGAGDDVITGSNGPNLIAGGEGNDTINGRAGDDVFLVSGSNDGFDIFKGGAGFDTVLGSAGDDIIGLANVAGHLAGIEAVDGGAGYDILRLTDGADTLNLAGMTVTGIELIEGGAGDDVITGSDGPNRISGGAGNDRLTGRAGDDVFLVSGSGDGFDVIKGGDGWDIILGSAGDDVIGLADAAGNLSGIESIDGGAGFDVLRLTDGDDKLDLSAVAVDGIERIEAGAGRDRITSSTADDVIAGGAGNDVFIFGPGFGHDTILDYDVGIAGDRVRDVIDLRGLGVASFAALSSHISASGDDTVIAFGPDDSLLLVDVAHDSLRADDFRFA